jgi:hypothetical protein
MTGIGAYYHLKIRNGNSRHFSLDVNNADGTPKDMSSEVVRLVAYHNTKQIFELTQGDGLTVTLGNIAITVSATRGALLKQYDKPKYELEFATDDDNSPCLLYGDIEVVDGYA